MNVHLNGNFDGQAEIDYLIDLLAMGFVHFMSTCV